MTYTFKLARRLARLRVAALLPVLLLSLSCADEDPSGPGPSTDNAARAGLTVNPGDAAVEVDGSVQFAAEMTDGSDPLSSTKGGKGKGRGRGKPGSSSMSVSPAAVTLETRATQRFTAALADSTVAPSVTWSATGGTIDSTGRYTAGSTPGQYRVIATISSGEADTAAATVVADAPTLDRVVISPATVDLGVGETQQFSAVGKASDGSNVAIIPKYSARGGTITAAGLYTAGQTTGSYRVIVTDSASGKADTAAVGITSASPTLQAIMLTPATVSLVTGGTQQFSASGRMSDGSTAPVSVTFEARGGTITQSGLYTAGSTTGTFRVFATESGGTLSDTAQVTVTSPPTTVSGCPDAGYRRVVNVSTVSQLASAISAASPGDQIRLASGTYALGSDLVITRSGTSSDRIVLCGQRTAIVSGRPIKPNGQYLQLQGFRITGGLWGIYSEGGSHNIFDGLEIDNTGQEAVHLRLTSKHNEIRNLYIHHTGRGNPTYGEGIYMGSGSNGSERADSNWVHHNRLTQITQECIESKEGTTGNLIEYNTLSYCGTNGSIGGDAAIVLRGDLATARYNTISNTPRYAMQIWPDCGDGSSGISSICPTSGKGNVLRANTMSGMGNDVGIQVRSNTNTVTNKVYCDNNVPAGSSLVAGTECTP
jgi:hypothetical protein